jgi:hypothetical protein
MIDIIIILPRKNKNYENTMQMNIFLSIFLVIFFLFLDYDKLLPKFNQNTDYFFLETWKLTIF